MLDRIIEFLDPYLRAPWGYVIVGVATFLENSVGAGVIVPGETLVIVGGFYARLGNLWFPAVAFVAVFGAVLGDNVGYWIGRRYGRGFLERHGRKLFITPERLELAEGYYHQTVARRCSSAGSSRSSAASAASWRASRGWPGSGSSSTTWPAP